MILDKPWESIYNHSTCEYPKILSSWLLQTPCLHTMHFHGTILNLVGKISSQWLTISMAPPALPYRGSSISWPSVPPFASRSKKWNSPSLLTFCAYFPSLLMVSNTDICNTWSPWGKRNALLLEEGLKSENQKNGTIAQGKDMWGVYEYYKSLYIWLGCIALFKRSIIAPADWSPPAWCQLL